jgi:steroid delta-isomerase-like uncharacterized protein
MGPDAARRRGRQPKRAGEDRTMSKQTAVRDTHYKGINAKDTDLVASTVADDVVTLTPQGEMRGIEAFRQFGEAFFKASPDATITIDRTFEDGNTLITEGTYTGTHSGDLVSPEQTLPASGNSFSFRYVDMMTFKGDKIVDHRIYWDNLAFMMQLGALG